MNTININSNWIQVCVLAENMKLLAVAAVGWPCTNPSISPGYWANNSKPAAAAFGGRMFRRIERRTDAQQFHRPGSAYYRAVSLKQGRQFTTDRVIHQLSFLPPVWQHIWTLEQWIKVLKSSFAIKFVWIYAVGLFLQEFQYDNTRLMTYFPEKKPQYTSMRTAFFVDSNEAKYDWVAVKLAKIDICKSYRLSSK